MSSNENNYNEEYDSSDETVEQFLKTYGYHVDGGLTYGDFLKLIRILTKKTDLPFILKRSDQFQASIKTNTPLNFFTILHLQCPKIGCNGVTYITVYDVIKNLLIKAMWCPKCIQTVENATKKTQEEQYEKIMLQNSSDIKITDINSDTNGYIDVNNSGKASWVEDSSSSFISSKYEVNDNVVITSEEGYVDDGGKFVRGKKPKEKRERIPNRTKLAEERNKVKKSSKLPMINGDFLGEDIDSSEIKIISADQRENLSTQRRMEYMKRREEREKLRNNQSINNDGVTEVVVESNDDLGIDTLKEIQNLDTGIKVETHAGYNNNPQVYNGMNLKDRGRTRRIPKN